MNLKLGGSLGYWLLKVLSKKPAPRLQTSTEQEKSVSGAAKLERFFGKNIWDQCAGKSVLDYGCGEGLEAVAVACRTARTVYGIDVQERFLAVARALAASQGVAAKCVFLNAATQKAEVERLYGRIECAYSLDSFEHFAKPEQIVEEIHSLLAPGGRLFLSFGPPWKHPFGCHMQFFNSLPWLHFLFKEETIMAVRTLYRSDGAKRFDDVEGGLNRMTVLRFLQLMEKSPLQVESFRAVPIRGWTWLVRNPWLREYFTSVVQCVSVEPTAPLAD